jgi:flagellar protein FlaI
LKYNFDISQLILTTNPNNFQVDSLPFEHELVGDILRINCRGSVYGSNIEDSDILMAVVIDKIAQIKKVERVVLIDVMENEYDFEQTRLLVEIANLQNKLLDEEKVLDPLRFGGSFCQPKISKEAKDVDFIVREMIKRDPIGAYVKTKRLIRYCKSKVRNGKDAKCYSLLLKNVLEPIRTGLEGTKIINKVKDNIDGYKIGKRTEYRKIFTPLIRPAFMLTRYISTPPKGSQLIERYKVPGDIEVSVFKVPDKIRLFYQIIPPEFRMSPRKYEVLEIARSQLSQHKPGESEAIQPEKARETFMNLSRDIIRQVSGQRGVYLNAKEIEELANILARYTAGFGILEVLLSDEKLQDVYINSPIGIMPIYVGHGDFEECETNLIPTREDAESWSTRFRMLSGRPLDEANPVLDTELFVPGGRARVAAITRTLSPEGIGYALRRHRDKPWTYPLFLDLNYFNPIFAGLMSFFVQGSRSLLIAGGRSSGKSSLLGATMLEIMRKHRIVTVEDTLELPVIQLRNLGYNIERMKSRSVITRIESELPAEEALRTALRLGDSSLIIGEVRSKEAQALWEAMRIGALAHVVAGTIHGESAYGVFDRVVNDLNVPKTSFKATDIVVVTGMIKSADGLHRMRRVLEVTEIRKHWKDDPVDEKGFVNLMEYSAKDDMLKPTDTLLNGESYIVNEIAKRVREWHGDWEAVWNNIELRGKVKQAMVDYARKANKKEVLEADWTVAGNDAFHLISNQVKKEMGNLDSNEIFNRWNAWFKDRIKKNVV